MQTRRSLSVNDVRDLGHLNPEAIAQVVAESQPVVRNADELHDVLLSRIVLPVRYDWESCFHELRDSGRAAEITLPNGQPAWVATERWPAARLVYKQAVCSPPLQVQQQCDRTGKRSRPSSPRSEATSSSPAPSLPARSPPRWGCASRRCSPAWRRLRERERFCVGGFDRLAEVTSTK